MENDSVLKFAIEHDSNGKKALLFSYKLYLLPNGDLQTAISNVEPDKLKDIFIKEVGPEFAQQSSDAVRYLIEFAQKADLDLEKVLGLK